MKLPLVRITVRRMIAAVAIAAAILALWCSLQDVHVRVTNHGPERLSSFVIYVTGNSYPIGDLDVGDSRTVRVRPSSESQVELEFVDHLGQKKRSVVECYFEPKHYAGTIAIEIKNEAIGHVYNRIQSTVIP